MLIRLGNSNNVDFTEEVLNRIIKKLDYCLPFFLQIIFEKIKYFAEIECLPLNKAIVDIAYSSLGEETHFNTWVERIDQQYGDNKTNVYLILKHLCQEKKGTKRESLINTLGASGLDGNKAEETISQLIYMLANDGYLMEEASLYRFRSPLLRDFWFNRFIK
jgi:hypothetical protein